MKVRFYCDAPEYRTTNCGLYANTIPTPGVSPVYGSKRIAFDVEMPPDVWKAFDLPAQASNVHVVLTDDEEGPDA